MKMMRRIGLLSVVAVLAVVVLTGANCSGLIPTTGQGNGTLRLSVTDKPFPFEFIQSAIVTLTRVEVLKVDTTDTEDTEGTEDTSGTAKPLPMQTPTSQAADDSEDETGGTWITVFEDGAGKSFDLVDLRNGRTNLLADAQLPAGTYTQMRLVVTGGEVTLTDGRTFPLTVPSGDTSGIKLHFTFEVVDGEQTDMLLDVDLSRAFQPVPGGHVSSPDGIRLFHFKPSVAMRLINLVQAGSISGLVTDANSAPASGVAVTAYDDQNEEVTSTSTDADGTYKLLGLTTGTYRVVFSAEGFDDAEVKDVSVTAGQETQNVNATLVATQP